MNIDKQLDQEIADKIFEKVAELNPLLSQAEDLGLTITIRQPSLLSYLEEQGFKKGKLSVGVSRCEITNYSSGS